MDQAQAIIDRLGLQPHPEGGWYAETWRGGAGEGGRATGTAIHFLLKAGERSHWHRVDAEEIWLWHAGAALELRVSPDSYGPAAVTRLGPDVLGQEALQRRVPAYHWQAAETTGDYTLVSCIVVPGFKFEGFELAPSGFDIPS